MRVSSFKREFDVEDDDNEHEYNIESQTELRRFLLVDEEEARFFSWSVVFKKRLFSILYSLDLSPPLFILGRLCVFLTRFGCLDALDLALTGCCDDDEPSKSKRQRTDEPRGDASLYLMSALSSAE